MGLPRQRPVFLNLLQIRLPVTGVVSILHRASGVLLVLLLPLGLWALDGSLASAQEYARWRHSLATPLAQGVLYVVLWLFLQHLFSGIRHLLLDLDFCVDRACARRSAWLTYIASLLTVAAIGVLA